jgi:hypothetical protein
MKPIVFQISFLASYFKNQKDLFGCLVFEKPVTSVGFICPAWIGSIQWPINNYLTIACTLTSLNNYPLDSNELPLNIFLRPKSLVVLFFVLDLLCKYNTTLFSFFSVDKIERKISVQGTDLA